VLPDRRGKDPEIVATNDFGGVRGREPAAQHRVHQAGESVVLLDEARIGPEGSLSVLVGRHGAMNPAGRVRSNMPIK
jgi:hypothetical protein